MIDPFAALVSAACNATFGVPAIYTPGSGVPVNLQGIFNEFTSDEKMNVQTGAIEQHRVPTLVIRESDLIAGAPRPCRSEAVIVDGKTWTIETADANGMGEMVLTLKRAE
jgi:hypothetical protein